MKKIHNPTIKVEFHKLCLFTTKTVENAFSHAEWIYELVFGHYVLHYLTVSLTSAILAWMRCLTFWTDVAKIECLSCAHKKILVVKSHDLGKGVICISVDYSVMQCTVDFFCFCLFLSKRSLSLDGEVPA